MTKPGMIALSKESLTFMRSNIRTFFAHLVFVLPLIMLIAIGKQALVTYDLVEWLPLTLLPTFYIYACFVLSWHRACLNGPNSARPVNPLMPSRGDWGFILLFFGVMGAFSLFLYGLSYLTEILLPPYGESVDKAGQVFGILAIVAALYLLLRVSFLFPAKAQGMTLSNRELFRASHRLTWPLVGSSVAFVLLFTVIFTAYTLFAGMVATIAGGENGMSRMSMSLVALLLSTPVHVAIFFLMALYTTTLSRAYQWGMQNNPI